MEDHLTVEELHRLFISKQKIDHEDRRFTAALKGVEMAPYVDPDDGEKTEFKDIKRRADIKRRLIMQGKNPNDYANIEEMENVLGLQEIQGLGFEIESE